MGKIPIVTNIFQMGWNHQLAKCWLQLLPTFNSKQTSGFNLDKSNKQKTEKKHVRRTPGKLQLTSENYTFTNYLLIFMFTPIPGNKIQVVSEHILYNFLPGWFNFNHQLLKTVALWRRVRTCGVFPKPTKVEGKLTFLRTEFGSLHLGRFFRKKKKKHRQVADGEFCWGIFLGFFRPWHLLRKKGGSTMVSSVVSVSRAKIPVRFFFFLRGMLAGERQALVAREESCNKHIIFFCSCT